MDPINPANPTGYPIPPPKTTSSGYVIGSQDPASPYFQGARYSPEFSYNPRNFTPSPRGDGRVLPSGYVVGSQMPDSPFFQGQGYGGDQRGAGRYLAGEFQNELVARGHYSTSPGNRGLYPGSDGTVRGQTLAGPINQGGAPLSGGRTVNPARQVNPRTAAEVSAAAGVATAGIASAIATAINGGGAFEAIGAGLGAGIGAHYGGVGGTIAGTAAGGKVGAVTIPVVGAVPGGVAGGVAGGAAGSIAGGIAGASAGGSLGRAIDDFIPDFPLPWPFNGRGEDYPNQTDPAAILPGPQTAEGSPGEPLVGTVPGAIYTIQSRITAFGGSVLISDGLFSGTPRLTGPISAASYENFHSNGQKAGEGTRYTDALGQSVNVVFRTWFSDGTPSSTNGSGSLVRADGGTDPTGPATPPTYAPNPARNRPRPTTPGFAPNLLPTPPQLDYPNWAPDTGERWPETQPIRPPDTAPLAPPIPAPSFAPTPSSGVTGEPERETAPTPAGRPDLDPNAPPRPAPDLATDPDTPARPEPLGAKPKSGPQLPRSWELPDGTVITDNEDGSRTIDSPTDSPWLEQLHNPNRPFVPNVLPVPVPVGSRWPVTTPSPKFSPNPNTNPNVRFVEQPVRQTPTEGPKGTCFYESKRVADIQLKATETQQRAANPTSGFTGLYGIGIESRVKLGETFTLVQTVNEFMRKAWRATRMDKVLNLLTFIGVMHNVSMLSRDVGETFFQLISQALQAVGIRDEEDNVIDVGQVVGNTVENFLKGILGEATYNGINEAWNKANRIISSASAIIWTVRSIADSSLDLMEWIGENTGRIGNALKRWGVVGERSYPWMSESARAQSRFRSRFSKVTDALENAEDRISVYTQATSLVIEVQDEVQEGRENWQRLRESVEDGIPDPWLDNNPVQEANTVLKESVNNVPDVLPSEAQKG